MLQQTVGQIELYGNEPAGIQGSGLGAGYDAEQGLVGNGYVARWIVMAGE